MTHEVDGSTRRLPTQVWLPAGDGPAPGVIFAHGLSGNPGLFSQLFTAWRNSGFAIAAPQFPVTSAPDAGLPEVKDLKNQPGDIAAVTTAMVSAPADDPAHGRFDPKRLVVAGLSLGGATALLAGYHDCCRDTRYRAVMAFSPYRFPMETGQYRIDGSPPLLLIHGDADAVLPYDASKALFASTTHGIDFITLKGGRHSPPYEDSQSPFDDLVIEVTTDYVKWATNGDEAARTDMVAAVKRHQDATLQSR